MSFIEFATPKDIQSLWFVCVSVDRMGGCEELGLTNKESSSNELAIVDYNYAISEKISNGL
jgi:hypothetical protein